MMLLPTVNLIRVDQSLESGTFGVWIVNTSVLCVTLERPDRQNAKNISSIPAGQYMCKRVMSPRFGDTFEVCDVVDRTDILLHPANLISDLKGCIGLGEKYGKIDSKRGILSSRAAFNEFMEAMIEYDEFHLTIREVY